MTRTHVQTRTSGDGFGCARRYHWGTSETAPGGAGNTGIPGPCRLTRSRLVTHTLMLPRRPGITQMGGI